MDNVFGEYHAPSTLKLSFLDSDKVRHIVPSTKDKIFQKSTKEVFRVQRANYSSKTLPTALFLSHR